MVMLPKPQADLGDTIADAMLDLIEQESPELQAALHRAIKAQEFVSRREPGDPTDPLDAGTEVVRFPALAREYAIPLRRIAPRRFDA